MLPKTLAIDINGQVSTMPPTHMVAIYSSGPSGPKPRHVIMYPIHQSLLPLYCADLPILQTSMPLPTAPEAPYKISVVPIALPNPESFPFLTQFLYLKNIHPQFDASLSLILASGIPDDLSLYCANLPVLLTSTPLPTAPEAPYEIPVMPIALPNPESFPFLTQFLYLKNVHPLFDMFLSLILASSIPDNLDQPSRSELYDATSCQPGSEGHGIWHNACALGISDIDLQSFFDLAWEVLAAVGYSSLVRTRPCPQQVHHITDTEFLQELLSQWAMRDGRPFHVLLCSSSTACTTSLASACSPCS
jgi:hypothetical protein